MPSYLWVCDACEQEVRIHRSLDNYKDSPSDEEAQPCQKEAHSWRKQLEMPKVFKESYVSGQRMKSDQSYAEYAKSLEIDCKLPNYRRNSDEYKEMKKESDKLKGRKTGEITRSSGSGKTREGT